VGIAFEIAIQCAGGCGTYNTDNKKPRQMSSIKKELDGLEMTHSAKGIDESQDINTSARGA
jgi:hypothetical protein